MGKLIISCLYLGNYTYIGYNICSVALTGSMYLACDWKDDWKENCYSEEEALVRTTVNTFTLMETLMCLFTMVLIIVYV